MRQFFARSLAPLRDTAIALVLAAGTIATLFIQAPAEVPFVDDVLMLQDMGTAAVLEYYGLHILLGVICGVIAITMFVLAITSSETREEPIMNDTGRSSPL